MLPIKESSRFEYLGFCDFDFDDLILGFKRKFLIFFKLSFLLKIIVSKIAIYDTLN